MSWLFSQVLVEEYLGENSLDGEQFVPLSGSNTQLAYLPQGWTDLKPLEMDKYHCVPQQLGISLKEE